MSGSIRILKMRWFLNAMDLQCDLVLVLHAMDLLSKSSVHYGNRP